MTDQLPTPLQSADFRHSVPDGDTKERRICNRCGFIDYVNPKIIAGAVIHKDESILLCRRAIEPRRGYWTLPAGFMEEDETVEEAARREAMEEAMATIELEQLLAVYSVPRISQVQMIFRAKLISGIAPGPESLEARLFRWQEIPWSELAFPTVTWALTHYSQSRSQTGFAPFPNPAGTERLTRQLSSLPGAS